jgi:hypothetical protein
MTTKNNKTEYVVIKVSNAQAKKLLNLKDLLRPTIEDDEPIASFREMAAMG